VVVDPLGILVRAACTALSNGLVRDWSVGTVKVWRDSLKYSSSSWHAWSSHAWALLPRGGGVGWDVVVNLLLTRPCSVADRVIGPTGVGWVEVCMVVEHRRGGIGCRGYPIRSSMARWMRFSEIGYAVPRVWAK